MILFLQGAASRKGTERVNVAVIGIPLMEDVMGVATLLSKIQRVDVCILQRYCLTADDLGSFNDTSVEIGFRSEEYVMEEIEGKFAQGCECLILPEAEAGDLESLVVGVDSCTCVVFVEPAQAPDLHINEILETVYEKTFEKVSGLGLHFVLCNPFSDEKTFESSFDKDDGAGMFEAYFSGDFEQISRLLGNYLAGVSLVMGRPIKVGLTGDLDNAQVLYNLLVQAGGSQVEVLEDYCFN